MRNKYTEVEMSFYDVVMLIVMGGAIWFGYWKGLAWQIASVAAIVVSYFVSVNFRDVVSPYIQAQEPLNRIAAMLILFLGTSLIIWTIYGSITKSLKKNELKGFDRQAGAMLGAAKGAILCMVITMFAVSLMGETAHNAVHASKFGPYVETGIWKASAFVPEEIARFVDPHIQNYKVAAGYENVPEGGAYPFGGQQSGTQPTLENPINSYSTDGQNPNGGSFNFPQNNQQQGFPAQPAGYQQQSPQYNQPNNYQNNGFQGGTGYQQQPTQQQPASSGWGWGQSQQNNTQPQNQNGWNQPGQTQNPQTQNQSGWNQSGWNQDGQTGQNQPAANANPNGWNPNFQISESTKELLEPMRQKSQEFIKQQGQEFIKDAAEKAANNWFGNGQ